LGTREGEIATWGISSNVLCKLSLSLHVYVIARLISAIMREIDVAVFSVAGGVGGELAQLPRDAFGVVARSPATSMTCSTLISSLHRECFLTHKLLLVKSDPT
jgi:hypothetical protein